MDNSFSRWKLQLFSGFRLRDPFGNEVTTRSRRLIDLLILLALQNDLSISRHLLAKQIFWDSDEGQEERLTVLLSRANTKLSSYGQSFLGITGDTVWLNTALIEVDFVTTYKLIEKIAEEAALGRPVKRLFESLGSMIAPLELSPNNIFLQDALSSQKHRMRHLIQTKLVPATGSRFATSVGSLIDVLGLEEPPSAASCTQLMLIFSGLGDIGSVHRIFARHEDAMDAEFGALVSHTTHEIYNLALSTEPCNGTAYRFDSIPKVPGISFGTELLLDQIESLVDSARKGDVVELVGPTGSGKTHLLASLYGRLSMKCSVLYCDLNMFEQESDLHEGKQSSGHVILIDNFSDRHISILSAINSSALATIAIIATEQHCNIPGTTTIQIPPLSAGTSIEHGPATQLILSEIESNNPPLLHQDKSTQFKYCSELVTLTGGNPGTLFKSLDIVKAVGFKSGIELIRSELLSTGPTTFAQSDFSFRKEILRRISILGEDHLKCCRILARLKKPISKHILIETCSISPSVFTDFTSLNVLRDRPDNTIQLIDPVEAVISSSEMGMLEPEEWRLFCESASLWLKRKSENASQNLEVASSMSALETICKHMLENHNVSEGLFFYESLSMWFASASCTLETTIQAEASLYVAENLSTSDWMKVVAAIGRGLFFIGSYERLLSFVQWARNSSKFGLLNEEGRYRLTNLHGLAHRSVENLDAAEQCYLDALELAPTSEAKVTLHFNLGCLAERVGDKLQALQRYERAALEFTPKTDRRLMSQTTLDIIRLRNDLFPGETSFDESLSALFRESTIANDRRAQAILLTDVGEAKCRNGQLEEAAPYMLIGMFLCFQMGFTKDSVRLCRSTIDALIPCLRSLGLKNNAEQIELLSFSFDLAEENSGLLTDSPILHAVLNEVLMRSLIQLSESGIEVPSEIRSFYVECDEIQAKSPENISVISTLESLKLRLHSAKLNQELESNPNRSTRHRKLDLSSN